MIVLKHLSREFNIEPHKLRTILRGQYGKRKRWQWEKEDEELIAIRKLFGSFTKNCQK